MKTENINTKSTEQLEGSKKNDLLLKDVEKLNQEIISGLNKLKMDYPLLGITFSISNHETKPIGLNIDIDSDAYKVYVKGKTVVVPKYNPLLAKKNEKSITVLKSENITTTTYRGYSKEEAYNLIAVDGYNPIPHPNHNVPLQSIEQSDSDSLIFAKKLYLCAQLLGAQSDLLSTISSWRQEVNDETTFECLDSWIDTTIKEQQESLNYITKWHKK